MKKNHSKRGVISKKRLNILKNKEKSYGSVQNNTHYLLFKEVVKMENILERIHYGLQFSPSTVNYISSKRDSKKTQKKINEKHLAQTSKVFLKIQVL